jgi:anti-sigma28 factor (negative regulator of flagellin synthesis)
MKIQNDGLTGSNPLEAGRTAPVTSPANSNAPGGSKISGKEGDSVEISGISSRLTESNAADGVQRANRVSQLAALYARGQYQVNSSSLSQALVSQALSGGESGSK